MWKDGFLAYRSAIAICQGHSTFHCGNNGDSSVVSCRSLLQGCCYLHVYASSSYAIGMVGKASANLTSELQRGKSCLQVQLLVEIAMSQECDHYLVDVPLFLLYMCVACAVKWVQIPCARPGTPMLNPIKRVSIKTPRQPLPVVYHNDRPNHFMFSKAHPGQSPLVRITCGPSRGTGRIVQPSQGLVCCATQVPCAGRKIGNMLERSKKDEMHDFINANAGDQAASSVSRLK